MKLWFYMHRGKRCLAAASAAAPERVWYEMDWNYTGCRHERFSR